MSWQQTTLGEVADIISGSTPKSDVPRYWDGGVAWATPTDLSRLDGKHLGKTDRTITEEGLNESSARLLPPGSVLFSSRAPIGLVAINTKPMATNQGFKSFVPRPEVNADYLYWWLRANRKQLEDLGNGATFKEVSKAVVSRVKFPLPPFGEQRRIAAILDKADAIRRKREQALALADDLVRSVFLEMFGDPIVNAKGLKKKPLSEFGKIVTGNTPPRSDPQNYGDEIEWIKSDNVNTEEHFLTRAVEGLSAKGKLLGRIVPTGSILVTCIAGSPSSIGKAAIADRPVALNQQINAITPHKGVNLYFLYAQFLIGKPLVMRSSTNSMKGMVSKGEFQKIEFMHPDPNEQEEFGKVFEKQIYTRRLLCEASRQAADLFIALSQRAFRGEL
jgi:type I restriction enzyme S subunit